MSKPMPRFANMPDCVKWRRTQTGCELKDAVTWAKANKSLWDGDDESEPEEKSSRTLLYTAIGLVIVVGAGFGIKTISDTISLACETQLSNQTKGAKWEMSRLLTLARKTQECEMLNDAGLASLIQDFNKQPPVK